MTLSATDRDRSLLELGIGRCFGVFIIYLLDKNLIRIGRACLNKMHVLFKRKKECTEIVQGIVFLYMHYKIFYTTYKFIELLTCFYKIHIHSCKSSNDVLLELPK